MSVAFTEELAFHPSINPLLAAAEALAQLDPGAARDPQEVQQALAWQAAEANSDDMHRFTEMLAAQAQVLHRIFTNATGRYAGKTDGEGRRLYAAIALKAQSYCRQTVLALARIRKLFKNSVLLYNHVKSGNETPRPGLLPDQPPQFGGLNAGGSEAEKKAFQTPEAQAVPA